MQGYSLRLIWERSKPVVGELSSRKDISTLASANPAGSKLIINHAKQSVSDLSGYNKTSAVMSRFLIDVRYFIETVGLANVDF